jgi:hypothetical protein
LLLTAASGRRRLLLVLLLLLVDCCVDSYRYAALHRILTIRCKIARPNTRTTRPSSFVVAVLECCVASYRCVVRTKDASVLSSPLLPTRINQPIDPASLTIKTHLDHQEDSRESYGRCKVSTDLHVNQQSSWTRLKCKQWSMRLSQQLLLKPLQQPLQLFQLPQQELWRR